MGKSMVDIKMLRPGMKVKVIDQWPADEGYGYNREMCRYLGQVVTVLEADTMSVLIKEDEGICPCLENGHFYWDAHLFGYIVADGKEVSGHV